MSNSLREAFLNLASALGHCQENSRSIVDALKRGCSDLAENSEGGGGGGSSQDYSTTEHVIGKWIDGTTDVYERTIDCSALPDNTAKTVASLTGIQYLIDVSGFAYKTSDLSNQRPLPFPADSGNSIRVDLSDNNLRLITYTSWSGYSAYLTIRYTKAS